MPLGGLGGASHIPTFMNRQTRTTALLPVTFFAPGTLELPEKVLWSVDPTCPTRMIANLKGSGHRAVTSVQLTGTIPNLFSPQNPRCAPPFLLTLSRCPLPLY